MEFDDLVVSPRNSGRTWWCGPLMAGVVLQTAVVAASARRLDEAEKRLSRTGDRIIARRFSVDPALASLAVARRQRRHPSAGHSVCGRSRRNAHDAGFDESVRRPAL